MRIPTARRAEPDRRNLRRGWQSEREHECIQHCDGGAQRMSKDLELGHVLVGHAFDHGGFDLVCGAFLRFGKAVVYQNTGGDAGEECGVERDLSELEVICDRCANGENISASVWA